MPTLSSKIALRPLSFFWILCETELWLQSHAPFADLILKKCSERDSFLTFSRADRALATVLCKFCQQLLPIEARNSGNRDPTSATREAAFPETKHRVSCPRIVSSLNSCVPDLVHFPPTVLVVVVVVVDDDDDEDDDNVVDMMVIMLAMTIVRKSKVF